MFGYFWSEIASVDRGFEDFNRFGGLDSVFGGAMRAKL